MRSRSLPRCSDCATRRRHRDLKHLVYRLTPVDAYDLRLVKRIGVLSITKDDDLNEAFVEVDKINATPAAVTATAHIHKTTAQGTRPTQVTLRKDDDLYELSGERSVYQGWTVEDIHADDRRSSSSAMAGGFARGLVDGRRRRPAAAAPDPTGDREPFREGARASAADGAKGHPRGHQAADAVLHRPGRQLLPGRRQVPRLVRGRVRVRSQRRKSSDQT